MTLALIVALLVLALALQVAGCIYSLNGVPRIKRPGLGVDLEHYDPVLHIPEPTPWVRYGGLCTPVGLLVATIAGILSLWPSAT